MKLFHIIGLKEWEEAKAEGIYHPQSLKKEGFIHASTKEQVIPTANRRYKAQKDLLLLCIDSEKVIPKIKYEYSAGAQQKHPHIYGELNLNAVESVLDFIPESDGYFTKFLSDK